VLEVEPTGTATVETASKTLQAPLQKHSIGGCTVDVPSRTAISGGIPFRRATLFFSKAFFSGSPTLRFARRLPNMVSSFYTCTFKRHLKTL